MPLPLYKLAILFVKQTSRPFAYWVSGKLKPYQISVVVGKAYYRFENWSILQTSPHGSAGKKKLEISDEDARQKGSVVIGESVLWGILIFLTYEFTIGTGPSKADIKDQERQEEMKRMNSELVELAMRLEQLDTHVRALERVNLELQSQIQPKKRR